MVSGLGSWSSHSIVFMSQPLCSHTACLEVQLLNIYSFGELPWRPDKILRVTCVEVSFYNGLSTLISAQANSLLMLQKLE